MEHIQELLPKGRRDQKVEYDLAYFRQALPVLQTWNISDATIQRHRAMLLEFVRQQETCKVCRGYESCGKEGDMRGFSQNLEPYGSELSVGVTRCQPYRDYQLKQRLQRWNILSGGLNQDESFQFKNFPAEQRNKYPRLIKFAEDFAENFEVGKPSPGLYIFGPPGVGKTHLLLAVLNRLRGRGVPSLFVRSDSIFDRMRHIIADNGDLEPLLEAYATAPVLGIDEFAQERANEFTLEKLFRIINQRFHAQLPTWFTSNYSPVQIYRKNGTDLLDSVNPLRSRIMQMAKLAKMDGDDARQRFLESLT